MDTTNFPPHQIIDTDFELEYKNVGELIKARAKTYPDKEFLFCPGKEEEIYTYREVEEKMGIVADYFVKNGFKKGERINLIIPNSAEFVFLYFAGLMLGITIVPINQDLSPAEMLFIINDSGAKAAFFDPAYQHKIEEMNGKTKNRVEFISVEEAELNTKKPAEAEADTAAAEAETESAGNPAAATKLTAAAATKLTAAAEKPVAETDTELTKEAAEKLTPPEIELQDEAIIIYTSGTTGKPKGVVLTHLNILADIKAVAEWFQLTPESRMLCILPLFHNNGQVITLLLPLYAGGSTVIVKGKASLMSFWGLAAKYKINWTSVMPAILSILLSLRTERTDNSMKGIFCGGQVLNPNVRKEFEKRFKVPIFEGFGLTETTSFACFNYFPADQRKIDSVGLPLPINQMSIRDDEGNELGPNEEGEIWIKGYNVAREYLGLPEKNEAAFKDGWFHSGDFGHKDETNHFYFKTRKDFLIIKGGENIYPAELENVLYEHPAVAESAVVGIPDKLLGEEICAFVKLHDNMDAAEDELKKYCVGKIAQYKQAKKIIIIDHLEDMEEIPKGPTKKVLYRKLREYYIKHNA